MQKVMAVAAFLLLACVSTVTAASEATVKEAVLKKIPEWKSMSVTKSPIDGLYEIYVEGSGLYYVDEKANHVIDGASIVEIGTRTNLTQQRLDVLTAVKFDQLPLNLALKKVKGKGTRKLAYFGDPNCGYCKRFEQGLAKIDDVTIYVFLYPVLGPDSIAKSKSIWCSKDRNKAWDDQLVNNIAPTAAGTCDTSSIDKALAFGKQKGITGTPTLFFADGSRVPGAIPVEQVEQRLAAAKQAK